MSAADDRAASLEPDREPPGSSGPSGTGPVPPPWTALYRLAAAALLLAGPALSVSSMTLKSATFDEPINLMHGIQALRAGDATAPVDYPPLSRWMAAAAVELSGAPVHYPPGAMPWTPGIQPQAAQRLLYLENDADRLLFWGRLAFVPLHLALAAAAFAWSRRCWGRGGALVTLALCALSPSLLAHAGLVTNDFSVTALLFLAFFFLARASRRLTAVDTAAAGLFLGLAMLSKYSALLGLPVFLVLAGLRWALRGPWSVRLVPGVPERALAGRGKLAAGALHLAGVFGVALLVVWAAYGFRYGAWRADDPAAPNKARLVAQLRGDAALESRVQESLLAVAEGLRVLPEPYLLGIRFTWKHMERRLSFFLGERSIEGSVWYFPVAFVLKTPLGALLLMGFGLLGLRRRRRGWDPGERWFLLLFPAAYFGYALLSSINLGQRYLLPVYPFLFVLAGGSVLLARSRSLVQRALFWGALVGFAASAQAIHPHHLAYFNELVGGPLGGIRYLGDSNLDWGQDLGRLPRWMDEHGVRHVKLGYFGTALPEYYGFSFEWLPSVGFLNDQPGTRLVREGDYLAVSATCLQGFYFQDMDTYRFLDRFEPIGHLGYSIYLYHIVPERLREGLPASASRWGRPTGVATDTPR